MVSNNSSSNAEIRPLLDLWPKPHLLVAKAIARTASDHFEHDSPVSPSDLLKFNTNLLEILRKAFCALELQIAEYQAIELARVNAYVTPLTITIRPQKLCDRCLGEMPKS